MRLNLKYWREKRGFSQEKFAHVCKLGLRTIQRYENGSKPNYSHEVLEKFCEVLNLHPSELFVWEDEIKTA